MSVCVLALVNRYANRIFSVLRYIIIGGMSNSAILFSLYLENDNISEKFVEY